MKIQSQTISDKTILPYFFQIGAKCKTAKELRESGQLDENSIFWLKEVGFKGVDKWVKKNHGLL